MATVIIRDRYQLTIPESIRENLPWLTPGAAMHLSLVENKLIIKPYQEKMINWKKIWKVLELVAKKGKKVSLTDFVIADRSSRR